MENKQTAVEFLESTFLNRLADAGIMISKYDLKLFEKAKEMEKKQTDDLNFCIVIIDDKVDDFTLLKSDIERLKKIKYTYGE
jgi:hypothetical protein